MKIEISDLNWAASEGIITSAQAEALSKALVKKYENVPHFTLGHVIYYFGALIIISSMAWFLVTSWEKLGGVGIFCVSLAFAVCFSLAGIGFSRKPGFKIPSGLLFTGAVCMTPLIVYGFEGMLGLWPKNFSGNYFNIHEWLTGSWFPMQLATVIVGGIALFVVRFPFILFPIALTLWYMLIDLSSFLFGKGVTSIEEREWVSVVYGAVVLILTYFVDRKTKEDFAFWGYMFGLLAFWGGLTAMNSTSELNKFLYCLLNFILIFLSVFLDRKIFIVLGGMGVFGYFGHLANSVFKDSMVFPFALSLLGFFVIYLGVKYQKNQEKIDQWVIAFLPESVRKLRPSLR